MYYEHFGFQQPPFRITPDTSLFFPGGNRGAILEALGYALRNGEGIVKVVGEVGSGKTMLCRMLELELPNNIEIVYLANPHLSPDNILHAIAFELKLDVSETDSRLQIMRALQDSLLERHAENKQVVVFVEEAQAMPMATLEEIRLLSNLETNQHKLLQIVLFGQPELDEMLARPQIRQLKERITYNFQLEPLRPAEIREYLNARLLSCGYRGQTLFTGGAINLIARYSEGLLRRVNILADKALLSAFANNSRRIGRRQVMAAVRDSEFSRSWGHYLRPAMLVLLLLALGLFAYQYGWRWLGHIAPQQVPLASGALEAPANESRPAMSLQPLAGDNVGSLETSPAEPATSRQSSASELTAVTVPEDDDTFISAAIVRDDMSVLMQENISRLPPEEVWLDAPRGAEVTCQRCAALIYRPLQATEKL